ncbi:MAG TPA: hypothetical protein VKC61_10380, partial [Pyrinomonadaceae bacterium]|nr:hypothetical protein [Pyrinomonadaceae bacterium]
GKLLTVVVGIVLIGVMGVLLLSILRKSTTPADTNDYEGTIVDRWADYVDSKYGSQPIFRLAVEVRAGKRFTVKVDPNVYESARVGMRIKSRSGQVVLIEPEQKTTVAK